MLNHGIQGFRHYQCEHREEKEPILVYKGYIKPVPQKIITIEAQMSGLLLTGPQRFT
jgi:hypothetical protein